MDTDVVDEFVDALHAAYRQYIAVTKPRADQIEVGPLAAAALQRYLRERTGGQDPDPVAVAIADALKVVGRTDPPNAWRIVAADGELLSEGIVST